MAEVIARLVAEDVASLPLLNEEVRRPLLDETARLSFRKARPVVGKRGRRVRQDFAYCTSFPAGGAFRGLAKALDLLVNGALALVHPPPIDPPLRFNDLILQRYELGSRGITPHRDHVRYVGLVAIVVLSGSARFFVCADRTAHDARKVPAPPGHLLLMRAPGFHGRRDRPFHFLTDVKARRYAFAVRHDAAPN